MRVIAIILACCAPAWSATKVPSLKDQAWPPVQQQWQQPTAIATATDSRESLPRPHHHRHKPQTSPPVKPIVPVPRPAPEPLAFTRLQGEVAALKRELEAVRAQVSGGSLWDSPVPFLRFPEIHGEAGGLLERAALGGDLPLPVLPPVTLADTPSVAAREREEVARARAYLVQTATPGYTMSRQGPELAIGRLHPAFAVRLADAIRWARGHGLPHCGIYSAYRPPAFGVGGFGDKFFSMHSYGLAADMTGIGSAGTPGAKLWDQAIHVAGLFLPYGENNRSEFNHTQLINSRMAWKALRSTITAKAPRDLADMWTTSGVHAYIDTGHTVSSARLLPVNDYVNGN